MRKLNRLRRGKASPTATVPLLLLIGVLLPRAGAAQTEPGQPVAETESRQLLVEKIEIEGNSKTRPQVILQHLTVEPGQPIGPGDLLESQTRLARTRFFKQVEVYTRPGSQKGELIVVVVVEERRWPYYRFEGGRGELEGWYIVPIGFCFDNFAGRGHRLDWKWRIGNRTSSSSLHYQHPELFSGAAALDVSLFGQAQEFFHFEGDEQHDELVESSGLRLLLRGREGRYRNAFLAFRSQHSDSTRVVALAAGLHTDTRDNSAYPLDGFWGRVTGELALAGIGGDVNFPRVTLDGRIYRRMGERNVFACRLHGGYVGRSAPFYERFYLGGPYSLRGYKTGRLTPPGWGTKVFLMQSEMRFPLSQARFPRHRHTGVLYYDVGGIWLPGELPGPQDLDHSFGMGYRLRLKVLGVLRIDFSLPATGLDENSFRFQISLGNAF